MFTKALGAVAPFLLLLAAPAAAQPDPPIAPADLSRHIDVLAADAFGGRAPGTEGERLTINYISEQLLARGIEPAGNEGWFQPVTLVERATANQVVRWSVEGRTLPFDPAQIALQGA